MYTLATLDHLRAHLGLLASETSDDPRLLRMLQAASAQIERMAGRRFSPRRAALQHDYSDARQLLLSDDLLEPLHILNGDGSSIVLTDVIAVPDEAPYSLLRLTGGSAFTWTLVPVQAITVTGIWGWHDRPAEMWRGSGDSVQDNPLSSSTTSLTVLDADGADALGQSPRFQVGHLLKIEDEYLRVLAVNAATNSLTVQRAVNGTAPAAHALGTPIYTYQPPGDINALALRWAAWLYKQADAIQSAPDDLLFALTALRRLRAA
ncbi:MAG: hypothetical protein JNJ61_02315 [Anaerolineae bacterium]|nr:hypothetical protein [Anaerolineae bacterium]